MVYALLFSHVFIYTHRRLSVNQVFCEHLKLGLIQARVDDIYIYTYNSIICHAIILKILYNVHCLLGRTKVWAFSFEQNWPGFEFPKLNWFGFNFELTQARHELLKLKSNNLEQTFLSLSWLLVCNPTPTTEWFILWSNCSIFSFFFGSICTNQNSTIVWGAIVNWLSFVCLFYWKWLRE